MTVVRLDNQIVITNEPNRIAVVNAPVGAQGPSGTTLTGRGAWTAGAYAKDEFVSYGGASYVANIATTSGDTPSVSNKWTLLASKGDTGATGSTGSAGATGAQGSSGVVSVSAPITNSGTAGSAALALTTNVANGVPLLTVDGLIDSSQLPAIAISDTSVVGSQAAMLALTAQVGDIAVRTDVNKSYILKTAGASTLANWQELLTPPDTVTSVASKTGNVTLANTDISGLGTASTKDVPAAGNASSSQVVYGTDTRLTDTRTPTDDSVTSAKIVDGAIVNADINASAGIVDTKLNLSAATTSGVTPSSSAKIVSAATTASGASITTTNAAMDSYSQYWFDTRSSNCFTVHRAGLGGSSDLTQTITNGYQIFARAKCLVAGSFTKIRFNCITAGSGLTDFRAAVWAESGTGSSVSGVTPGNLITSTGNLMSGTAPTGTLATALYNNQSLSSTVTLNAGDIVWLGFVCAGTTPPAIACSQIMTSTMAAAGVGGAFGIGPAVCAYSNASYTGGTVPALGTKSSYYKTCWLELIA